MTKIVYIMGAGRSGSTALGIALGAAEPVYYAGELIAWPIFEGIPASKRQDAIELWARVRERCINLEANDGYGFHGTLEHHRGILRPGRYLGRSDSARYTAHNHQLLRTVREETGAEWIVDSSHYALRAGKLIRHPKLDVFILNLVRDPRSVINALQKRVQRHEPMSPLQANLYCLAVWFFSTVVYLMTPKRNRIRVRYEDFVREPAKEVGRIYAQMGLETPVPDMSEIETGPIFQGNRLREKERISISPQPSKNLLSRGWRFLSTLIQLPVLVAYGYRLRDSA